MKLILTTHNLTLTESIEDHIRAKLEKVEHLDQHLIEARVTIEHDAVAHGQDEKKFKCNMRIVVRGPDFFAEDSEDDLYKAIDLVTKKIEQQIRTRHNKEKAKAHSEAAREKERLHEEEMRS